MHGGRSNAEEGVMRTKVQRGGRSYEEGKERRGGLKKKRRKLKKLLEDAPLTARSCLPKNVLLTFD